MIDTKVSLMVAFQRQSPAVHSQWKGGRLGSDERGAGAVELALIAPLLVGLLLGTVHFGSVAVHRMQMANAVRAGLQYASVRKPALGENTDLTPINTAVESAAPAATNSDRSIVSSLYCECSDGTPTSCENSCETGNRSVFIGIVMTESYASPLKMSGAATITLKATGSIRVN